MPLPVLLVLLDVLLTFPYLACLFDLVCPCYPCCQVTLHNFTEYDLQPHFANTNLPAFALSTEPCDLTAWSFPPPARAVTLKIKVRDTEAAVELHGRNYPLRNNLADCGCTVGPVLKHYPFQLPCSFFFFPLFPYPEVAGTWMPPITWLKRARAYTPAGQSRCPSQT